MPQSSHTRCRRDSYRLQNVGTLASAGVAMVLITGGMGFIGIRTARALVGHDDLVLGYHRPVRGQEELRSLIGAKVETVRLDVTSPYSMARALAQFRPSSIIHLAVPALD